MSSDRYDTYGNLRPRPSVPASERNTDSVAKVLTKGAALLQSDGVYDGAVAAFYVGAIRPKDMAGLFTSQDTHAGESSDPARLQRYAYAGESPMATADPA